MIIKECYIENFGKLSRFKKTFSEGFNVIVSENGWGKTTFSLFLRTMLFGMESKRAKNSIREKYRPWQGGKYGGYIIFEANGKTYRAERYFFETESKDAFTLYDCETGLISQDFSSELGKELLHTDRETFEKTAYVPHGNVEVNFENDGKIIAALESGYNIGDRDYDKAYDALMKAGSFYEKRTGGKIPQTEREVFELNEKLSCEKDLTARKSELENMLGKYREEAESLKKKIGDENKKQGAAIVNDEISHFRHKIAENISKMKRIPTEDELSKLSKLSDAYAAAKAYSKEEDVSAVSPENKKRIEDLSGMAKGTAEPKKVLIYAPAIAAVLFFAIAFFAEIYYLAAPGVICLLLAIYFISGTVKAKRLNREAERLSLELTGKPGSIKTLEELAKKAEFTKKEASESKENEAYNALRDYALLFTDTEPERAYITLTAMVKEIASDRENIARAEKRLAELGIGDDFLPGDIKLLQDRELVISDKIFTFERELCSVNEKAEKLPELAGEYEKKKTELERLKKEYYIITETANLLTDAKTALKSRYSDKIKSLFTGYANLLNAPDGAELDSELNINVLSGGETHRFSDYSCGERDLFGLALRFAVLGAIYDSERPAAVLDDPLVNLDEDKRKRALSFLCELSKQYQMIYFTCDKTRIPDNT